MSRNLKETTNLIEEIYNCLSNKSFFLDEDCERCEKKEICMILLSAYEEGHREGWYRGYDEGYEEGYDEGYCRGRERRDY